MKNKTNLDDKIKGALSLFFFVLIYSIIVLRRTICNEMLCKGRWNTRMTIRKSSFTFQFFCVFQLSHVCAASHFTFVHYPHFRPLTGWYNSGVNEFTAQIKLWSFVMACCETSLNRTGWELAKIIHYVIRNEWCLPTILHL